MHDTTTDETQSLLRLYDLTISLLSDETRITRALDWVDQVLPVFARACRADVRSASAEAIARWEEWLNSDSVVVVEEAGKGEVFDWRLRWLRTLLDATRQLKEDRAWSDPAYCTQFAEDHWTKHRSEPACFPLAYWQDVTAYLTSTGSPAPPSGVVGLTQPSSQSDFRHAVAFPLVLSEPIVDGGSETTVILAQFLFEPASPPTGEVFLHPEQAVVRCMDDKFADTFRHAARAAKHDLGTPLRDLPGVRIRIQTLRPSHERFLCGTMLRGDSGGGALAVGLKQIYTAQARTDVHLAVSFALHGAASSQVDGKCHEVASADEKVRGCAKHALTRLLVAKQQQGPLAMYGRKHNVEILGATTVTEAATLAGMAAVEDDPATAGSRKVVILYQRRDESDRRLVQLLEEHLSRRGHDVFIDLKLEVGIRWAREIEARVRDADAVIVLLSESSVASEMLASELQTADEARQRNGSKPNLLPIRVAYQGPLPERIAHILEPLQHALWESPADDASLLASVERALDRPDKRVEPALSVDYGGTADRHADFEPFDGLVPVGSPYYLERNEDRQFLSAVGQRHSVVLLKGARQMGKSSLLARGLKHAEGLGYRTVFTDFQKLSMSDLASIQAFYLALGRMVCRQLKIEVALDDVWVDRRSPNLNFEEYIEDYVLASQTPILWAMDEVDKLFFATDFSSDVFGLFRSWANERQGRTSSPWSALSLAIAYATEAHLFIADVNQSPFNVGTRFEMRDFTQDQFGEMNRRYGNPVTAAADVTRLYRLLGGHPYLVRRGLYAIVTEKLTVNAFETESVKDSGPLGDHLRRILTLLARNPDNVAAMQEILRGRPCPSFETFYHLRSAGVIVGESVNNASVRCQLYKTYLQRHLL